MLIAGNLSDFVEFAVARRHKISKKSKGFSLFSSSVTLLIILVIVVVELVSWLLVVSRRLRFSGRGLTLSAPAFTSLNFVDYFAVPNP